MAIGWLVMDLGGVCAEFRPDRRLAALAAATGLPPHDVDQRLFTSGFDAAAETGAYGIDAIVPATLALLDDRLDADSLIAAWATAFDPDDDVLDLVRRANVPACLFTNNGPLVDLCLDGPLAQIGGVFELLLGAWQVGATKPSAIAFERAAGRLGARGDELLFVDDSAANVDGARRCGWHAVIHTDASGLESVLREHGPL